jgi:hypothetical protein
MSKGRWHYTEMHILYTDANKMLFFHVVTVPCNVLLTSFDKLLYSSKRTKLLLVVEARNVPPPLPHRL